MPPWSQWLLDGVLAWILIVLFLDLLFHIDPQTVDKVVPFLQPSSLFDAFVLIKVRPRSGKVQIAWFVSINWVVEWIRIWRDRNRWQPLLGALSCDSDSKGDLNGHLYLSGSGNWKINRVNISLVELLYNNNYRAYNTIFDKWQEVAVEDNH